MMVRRPHVGCGSSSGHWISPGENGVTRLGIGFTPPRYLVPGDEVRVSIAGIGELVNRFV